MIGQGGAWITAATLYRHGIWPTALALMNDTIAAKPLAEWVVRTIFAMLNCASCGPAKATDSANHIKIHPGGRSGMEQLLRPHCRYTPVSQRCNLFGQIRIVLLWYLCEACLGGITGNRLCRPPICSAIFICH